MAAKEFTRQRPPEGHDRYHIFSWEGMRNNDVGEATTLAQLADRSIQVAGTFDGGSVTIEGSIDGANYATLTDPQGNPLVFTAAKIEAVTELVRYIRPVVTGGASTNLNVHMLMRLS